MRTRTHSIAELVEAALRTASDDPSANADTVLMTGIETVDEMTGGVLRPGCVTLLTGTSPRATRCMAYRIALNAALKQNLKVAYATLSGDPEAVVRDMLSMIASVDEHQLRRRRLTKESVQRLAEARQLMSKLPLFIVDGFGLGYENAVNEIFSKNYDYAEPDASDQLKLVVIDSLSELSLGADLGHRHKEIELILTRLTEITRNHKVAVLLLADLAPNHDQWLFRDAGLSDLPHFRAIAPNVDVFLLLDVKDDERQGELAPLSFSVFRNPGGRTGKLFLNWDSKTMRFSDMFRSNSEAGN